MHCDVNSIRLYPIFGITEFQTPWSRLDHCIVAWAGVIAQAVVAAPIVVAVTIFGYSRFEAVLAILGFFSLAVAVFNLLSIKPLDGSVDGGSFQRRSPQLATSTEAAARLKALIPDPMVSIKSLLKSKVVLLSFLALNPVEEDLPACFSPGPHFISRSWPL
jgi:Zn-dependent protease